MTLRDDVIACQCQIPDLIELYPRYFPTNEGRRFVEVGAFDGFHWSNTYPLVNLGWSGLMFEPAAEFYQMCRERYQNNPLIEVEQCAISDECRQVKLFPGGSMTTIEEDLIEVWNKNSLLRLQGLSVDNFVMCEAHTLDCRLAAHYINPGFDLLSIDVEGADDRVLVGLSLDVYRPKMVIIELDTDSQEPLIMLRSNWILGHMIKSGYDMIHHDAINTIYWRNHADIT